MNLRQLEVFIRVAETKSMSKAAQQLYISQPAVSQTIAELEDSLETKLFERINRRLLLTNSGEVLYTYSKRIIGLLSEAQHQIKDLANLKRGKLSVGASTTIGIYLLPQIIGNFKKLYPNIEFIFTIDNTSVIEALLLDAQIDIGIVEGPIFSKDLELIHFAHDQLEIICSSEHKWARSQTKQITIEDLEKETLIFREEGSGTREIIENVLKSKGVNYRPQHILNNTEAIKKAV
ncbi:MAG: LysR family transcriptional regulator, partial [Syntrophomonadaceae bacterium]|nr:LysR family transcriptional regulator [Syntrophomonadaceae bacterium]